MYIHNLVVSAVIASATLSGCASTQTDLAQTPAPSAAGTPIDYSCEPGLDINWVRGKEPAYIRSAMDKSWTISRVQVDGLIVTYHRDCSASVRQYATDQSPYGRMYDTLFCHVGKLHGLFARDLSNDEYDIISVILNNRAEKLLTELESTSSCVDKEITPVG